MTYHFAGVSWTRKSIVQGPILGFDINLHLEQASKGTAEGHPLVHDVELGFARGTQSWIMSVDWVAFSRTVASFPQLKNITVTIEKDFEEGKATYMKHAHERLTSLSYECGIQLVVRDGSPS